MKLKWPQKKFTKNREEFQEGGGGEVFLAGQNMYPWNIDYEFLINCLWNWLGAGTQSRKIFEGFELEPPKIERFRNSVISTIFFLSFKLLYLISAGITLV